MNELQQTKVFIESECAKLECGEIAKPLSDGYETIYEANFDCDEHCSRMASGMNEYPSGHVGLQESLESTESLSPEERIVSLEKSLQIIKESRDNRFEECIKDVQHKLDTERMQLEYLSDDYIDNYPSNDIGDLCKVLRDMLMHVFEIIDDAVENARNKTSSSMFGVFDRNGNRLG